MQPIIGFNYGAQKYERVKKTFKLAISANLVVSFIGWALFQFCTSTVLSIFGSGDANYFEFATMFMRIYLMLVCIDGVQMLSSSFFASMTRQVLFLIPLVLILPKFFGLNGILYAAPIADFVAFVVSVICILAEFKKLNELEKSRKTNSL